MNKTFLVLVAVVELSLLINTVSAQSDLYLEAKVSPAATPINLPSWYSLEDVNVTKFEIQVNSGSYKEICPSLQCKIEYKGKSTFFPPDIPDKTSLAADFDFRLHDDITHSDFGPKKKELVEQYRMHIFCTVKDIVEKNGQEVYYCDNDQNSSIVNKFYHDKSWNLGSSGIYDAKNHILKVNGTFTK